MNKKDLKKFYSFENYKPNKNAVPVIPEGIMAVGYAVPERVDPINDLGVFDDDAF